MVNTVRLKDIMKPIISIDISKTAKEAAQKIVTHHIGSVVVKDGNKPVGIITKSDIVKKVTLKGIPSSEVKVSDFMSKPLITIDLQTLVGDTALEMQERKIKRLLVTEKGKVVGIVSQKDLQEAIMKTLLNFLRPGQI